MKQLLIPFTFLISFLSFSQEFDFNYQEDFPKILEQTNDTSNVLHYDKLLARFQDNDTTLTDFEVLALLIGFTDNEYFKPYSYLMTERDIYSLNGEGNYKEALAMSDSFLINVPLSQQVLIEKSYSFYKLDEADSAQYYLWQGRRIFQAMALSGDGLTPETAYFSLGPADGQNLLKKFFAVGIGTMGSGRDKYGNFVDILEATWEDEETGEKQSKSLYFQIEHATKTMFDDINFDDLEEESSDKEPKKGRKKKQKKK